jgi:hypothetical protein
VNENRWSFDRRTPNQCEKFAIVVHGLNLRPRNMSQLIEALVQNNYCVLNLMLKGHEKNNADKEITHFKFWEKETFFALEYLKIVAGNKKVLLVGYSLGALVLIHNLKIMESLKTKVLFFAPAIRTRNYVGFIRILFLLPFQLSIKSFSPASHRVHERLDLSFYRALFQGMDHVSKDDTKDFNITCVMDPRDKLISWEKLIRIYPEWKFIKVYSKHQSRHLIIDPDYLENESWKRILAALR